MGEGPKRSGCRGIEANGSGRERAVLTVMLVDRSWGSWDKGGRRLLPLGSIIAPYVVVMSWSAGLR
jgi:hypothetical protein